tara:strand:- start:792 stop:944 length:153 start_codon:yes stop_codon:yes gene_type:complete
VGTETSYYHKEKKSIEREIVAVSELFKAQLIIVYLKLFEADSTIEYKRVT